MLRLGRNWATKTSGLRSVFLPGSRSASEILQSQADAVMRVQVETAVELDALMPSILSKAFVGEL